MYFFCDFYCDKREVNLSIRRQRQTCIRDSCLIVSVLNDTTITCDTPAGTSGDVGVTVTTPGGTTSPQTFTYQDLPTVTAVAPASGPGAGANQITITATNFARVPGLPRRGPPSTILGS